jgi:hypothetical protein
MQSKSNSNPSMQVQTSPPIGTQPQTPANITLTAPTTPPIRVPKWQDLKNLNTPQQIQIGIGAIGLSAIMAIGTSLNAINIQRQAFITLAKDTTPSITNAQKIKDSLADLDTNVANELLQSTQKSKAQLVQELAEKTQINASSSIQRNPDFGAAPITNAPEKVDFVLTDPATGNPKLNPTTGKPINSGIEYRQNRATGFLLKVSQNITYAEEWQPIWELQYGLGNYLELSQQALVLNAQGDTRSALAIYRQAGKLMDEKLLPTADKLANINRSELQKQLIAQRQQTQGNIMAVLFFSGLLLFSLVGLQWRLYQRTRRMLNPLLLGATVLAFAGASTAIYGLNQSGEQFRIASQDAFKSLFSLQQLRSLSYMANAAESRYLLELKLLQSNQGGSRQFANQYEQDFADLVDQIYVPATSTQKAAGLMGKALDNLTFEGEGEAINQTVTGWNAYVKIDRDIRQLVAAGDLKAAIDLCLGDAPNQSNGVFEKFRDAHNIAFDINRQAFDQAFQRGNGAITSLPLLLGLAGVGIPVLAFFGCLPRLREYDR